jgi:hypothetical protein
MQSLESAIYEVQGQGVKLSAPKMTQPNDSSERADGWRECALSPRTRVQSRFWPQIGFSQNAVFLNRINVIWPVQSHLQNNSVRRSPKSLQ